MTNNQANRDFSENIVTPFDDLAIVKPDEIAKGVILEQADAFGADLIVVGSHGYGMLERFLLGSVSQAVALHARCSVLIVRGPKTQTSESK